MDRLFRIDFYPQEWLLDTSRMKPIERGIFIQIVALIYANRGPIENDPAWIAGMCGCSKRLVRSIIQNLVDEDFIQLSALKITQRRCELELNMKRTHLEQSAKGGRKSSEKRREDKKNNDIGSSGTSVSVSSPSPSPSARATAKANRSDGHDLKNDLEGEDLSEFRCMPDYDQKRLRQPGRVVTFETIKALTRIANANGWDGGLEHGHQLEREFWEWIESKRKDVPRDADRAVIAWARKYFENNKQGGNQ